jgi:HSP20 family protein
MNGLNHWNWLRDLEAFQKSRDSLLSRSPTHKSERQQLPAFLAEWAPVMHISEDNNEYQITAELSEAREEDVKVTAQKGTLTITGQRRLQTEETPKNHHCIRPVSESFEHTYLLPNDVRPENVHAEFKVGVLVVLLVKDPTAGPQSV